MSTKFVGGDAKEEQINVVDTQLTTARKLLKGNQQLMISRKTLGAFKSGYLDRSRLKSAGEGRSFLYAYNTIHLMRSFQKGRYIHVIPYI